MQSLGYETLLTILLPGSALLLALFLVLIPAPEWSGTLTAWETHQATLAVGLLLAATLVGTILASAFGVIEEHIYDRFAARRLGISASAYLKEWQKYVDDLEKSKNAYIDRLVLYFCFESRAGVALLLLSMAIRSRAAETSLLHSAWWWGAVVGAFLILQSLLVHGELARFRHRRYPA